MGNIPYLEKINKNREWQRFDIKLYFFQYSPKLQEKIKDSASEVDDWMNNVELAYTQNLSGHDEDNIQSKNESVYSNFLWHQEKWTIVLIKLI